MTGTRVLVLCFDPVGPSMAGPAIRAWHLAEALAGRHDVTLGSTVGVDGGRHPFDVAHLEGDGLRRALGAADAVVGPVSVAYRHGDDIDPATPLAVDLYIPPHLENLEAGDRDPDAHRLDVARQVDVVNADLARGDTFLCASERQRDFWLGALATAGRVNPATYAGDPALRRLIDVVPFGLPDSPPVAGGPALRRRFPAIGPADPVIVWGGGVYDWLDPESVVLAVDRLHGRRPTLRLVFLGMRNPHPDIPEMAAARRVRALAGQLGLTDRHVFFNEEWIPLAEWGATLLDADVAVSTHPDHLETRFSFRTRVLDYLWAARPMVLTAGDDLSALVDTAGVGRAVPAGDVDAIAAGLEEMLDRPVDAGAFAALQDRFRWSNVVAPVLRWADAPTVAPDRTPGPPAAAPAPVATDPTARMAGVPGRALAGELARRAIRRSDRALHRR